ncbi:MAG: DUF1295 domain-containing protein [Phycisphaerales bacterium]|nr:DUF1295 domain-containing protein [Phycisphaerales bacterium]
MNPWLLVLILWGASAAWMLVLWFVQRARGNAGIVDVGWALGIGVAVGIAAWCAPGAAGLRILVATLTGFWSLRLGLYLWRRITREPEDGRYRELREWAGERVQAWLFVFYQIQASWIVLFALPQLIVMQAARPLGWREALAVLIFLVSVVGEVVADRQLAAFRRNSAHRGRTCRVGLWRYSRHPNYFFEWLHWWAYCVLAISVPWGWLTLVGPAAMLFLLLKVTGVPPTERQALRSRGDDYRAYQRTTSVFFPWPPQKEPA